jgi:heptosyltransferase-2
MKRIAVFLPNWIGDVVMATPAIRALRETFPQAEMISVSKPYVADTLAGSPWFQRTLLFDKKGPLERRFLNVAKQLREAPIDAAVLFPNSLRAAALAKIGGAKRIVGFARYFRDFLLTQRLYPARGPRGSYRPVPMIDDYNRVVQLLGVPDPGYRMELFTTPHDDALANDTWQRLKLNRFPFVVGLNSGGAFGSSKHWPTPYFAELAAKLVERFGCGVVVLCGPSERETAKEIASKSGRSEVMALADEPLSIGFTKTIVKRLGLLVTTDSGPRHFAAAFDRPVVSLFGPTHIGWTETYFPKAVHIQKPVPCGPCQLRVCPLDHRCMTTLMPGEVLETAWRLLESIRRTERRHAS